jgi:hypothetical protein
MVIPPALGPQGRGHDAELAVCSALLADSPVTYLLRNWLAHSAVAVNPPNGSKCGFVWFT